MKQVPLAAVALLVALSGCVASSPSAEAMPSSPPEASNPAATSVASPSIGTSAGQVASPTAQAVSSPTRPAPSAPRASSSPEPESTPPPWARDLVGTLECDGKPQPVGDAVGEGSPGISADDDAETALKVWIGDVARFYVALPLGGFDVERRSEHFVLFAHRSEGEAKVLVLAADIGDVLVPGSWTVTRFAACDASEFARDVRMGYDVRIWTDNEGRVPTARLLEREDCYGGRALRVDGQLFVRDPTGDAFDRKALLSTYHGNVALPKSARLTAYRDGDRLLHLAADGSAAFVESPARVERWPRVRGDEYVRTDCN